MNTMLLISPYILLHLWVTSSAGSIADASSDAACIDGSDSQCSRHDQEEQEDSSGHALLTTRSAIYRTTVGTTEQFEHLEDGSGKQPLSRSRFTSELLQLTTELDGDQMQKMLDLMKDMRSNSTPHNKSGIAKDGSKPLLSMMGVNAAQPIDEGIGADDEAIFGTAPKLPGEDTTIPDDKEAVDKTRNLAKFVVVPVSIVFLIVYNVSTLMEKAEITAIPESSIVIAIGVVLGVFMKKYSHFNFFESSEEWAHLNTAMLNLLFLPIIIFASGWVLRRQDFFSQFPYILLFAVVGTGVSTCVVAGLIWFTGSLDLHHVTRWRTAFAYASLISATDPVATLATYSKLKVAPLLNIMVFGEATINDAVAIVLFKIFNSDESMLDPVTGADLYFGPQMLGNILYGIWKGFFGSLFLGVGLGFCYTLIARACDMAQNKKGQILVIFVSCYLTYALAESIHLSGIIAEIFCSIVMAVYMKPHLSLEGSSLASFFITQIASLADCAVFLLVGVSVAQLTIKGWSFGLWTMLFCLIARACSVFPIAYIVNGLKVARGMAAGEDREGWNLLPPQYMFMMWHGGLRGGIALALAWELGPWVDAIEGTGMRHALQTATFLVILVFLVVFGGSTTFMLKALSIEFGKDHPEDVLAKTECTGTIHDFMTQLDRSILTPVLVGDVKETEGAGGTNPENMDAEDLLKMSMHVGKFTKD
jgi:sodium/hydrogen exchanger 8